jgi:hypothetical protein
MGQYLMDNNAISNFFSSNFDEIGMDFVAAVIDQTPLISVITEIEALSWVTRDKSKELLIQQFINDARILSLSPLIVSHCVRLRRSRRIKTPDAIIAATAIAHNLTLLTSDKDFANIEGLKVIDPNHV